MATIIPYLILFLIFMAAKKYNKGAQNTKRLQSTIKTKDKEITSLTTQVDSFITAADIASAAADAASAAAAVAFNTEKDVLTTTNKQLTDANHELTARNIELEENAANFKLRGTTYETKAIQSILSDFENTKVLYVVSLLIDHDGNKARTRRDTTTEDAQSDSDLTGRAYEFITRPSEFDLTEEEANLLFEKISETADNCRDRTIYEAPDDLIQDLKDLKPRILPQSNTQSGSRDPSPVAAVQEEPLKFNEINSAFFTPAQTDHAQSDKPARAASSTTGSTFGNY
jgi:hypothetical protein